MTLMTNLTMTSNQYNMVTEKLIPWLKLLQCNDFYIPYSKQLRKSDNFRGRQMFVKFITKHTNFKHILVPVLDCKWSSWSKCSKTCGTGKKTRTIQIPPKNGGKQCSGSSQDNCNTQSCVTQTGPLLCSKNCNTYFLKF